MMNEVLPAWPLLAAFVVASLVLAITPGPGVLYIVTRSLSQGRSSGMASVTGVALGNLGNAIGASIGLTALFAVSSASFTIVKYAGALYFIYLGIKTLRTPQNESHAAEPMPASFGRIFRDGFIVALLNPKTAIFFAAFLPQFMGAENASMLKSAVLGSLFVVIAATTDTAYALAASVVAPALTRTRSAQRLGRYATGSIFIGLGIFTALSGQRGAK